MFSGKTDELIRRLRLELVARHPVQVFKPVRDTRYSADAIVSHDAVQMRAEVVAAWSELPERLRADTEVVGIDEANLLGRGLPRVAQRLAERGLRVIVAGLDMDHMGRPFAPIPELLAVADYVAKNASVCGQCGSAAVHTQRIRPADGLIVVGSADIYEARCRLCFRPAGAGVRRKALAAGAL
jgi:thymidine kinase